MTWPSTPLSSITGERRLDAMGLAAVDDDLARVGIGRVVQHLGAGPAGVLMRSRIVQQLAQALVFQRQLLELHGSLGLQARELRAAAVGIAPAATARRLVK